MISFPILIEVQNRAPHVIFEFRLEGGFEPRSLAIRQRPHPEAAALNAKLHEKSYDHFLRPFFSSIHFIGEISLRWNFDFEVR